MKALRTIFCIVLYSIITSQYTFSQRLEFITYNALSKSILVGGMINVSFMEVEDNLLTIGLTVDWQDQGRRPLLDNQSVIGFIPQSIEINKPNKIKFLQIDKNSDFVAFNKLVSIKFEIQDIADGDEIVMIFPLFYSKSLSDAAYTEKRQKLRNEKKLVVTKQFNLPPKVSIIRPEGATQGFNPIIYGDKARIELKATDFNGINKVLVNNTIAENLGDSVYAIDLMLRYGFTTSIRIIAEDSTGLTSKLDFSIESREPIQNQIAKSSTNSAMNLVEPSDVDIDIPIVGSPDPNRYALIVGNEDYSSFQRGLRSESNVDFAIQDAEIFKKYALNVLCIPEYNIIFLKNAGAIEMHRAINQINAIIKTKDGKSEVFVYYAGHGFPDEKNQEPYLIPVDVSGADLQFAIKLSDFYSKLTEFPSKRVTVFLDACFSGGGRIQGLLASRAVRVRPKENLLSGNLVVFAAASGDQTALPWSEKSHGMFTYHLLKLLKERSGEITYGELADYLHTNVATRSIIVNHKEQNPQTNISPTIEKIWKEWKFRE